ncbi:MAG: O-antigen ligase family protein [Anaerolineaceae bacterium]|nr:O-antigen ligase family protein [Anaerolineaceae bacterium]
MAPVSKAIDRWINFIDHWQLVILFLIVPFVLAPPVLFGPALFVVPLLWWAAKHNRDEWIPATPLNLSLLVLAVMMLVSLFASYRLSVSLPRVIGMVYSVALFLSVARRSRRAQGWWWIYLFLLGAGCLAAVFALFATHWLHKIPILDGILQYFPERIRFAWGGEVKGMHPNAMAGILLWVLPPLVSLWAFFILRFRQAAVQWGNLPVGRWMALLSLATAWVGFVFILTQSRTSYLALLVTLLAMAAWVLPGRVRRAGLFLAACLALVGLVALRGLASLSARLDFLALPAFSLHSLGVRAQLWQHALLFIKDMPVTGIGMGTFQPIMEDYFPFFVQRMQFYFGHAHNGFLQAALDLGIPGLVAMLALYVGGFWMLARAWLAVADRRPPTRPGETGLHADLARALILGVGGALLADLLYSCLDVIPLGYKEPFFMLLGLAAGLAQRVESGRWMELPGWRGGRA